MTEDDIGFMIGPRINAASRMDKPETAARLLATNDVTGANESKYVRNVILNTLISNDTNTVAIEIHQFYPGCLQYVPSLNFRWYHEK